MRVYFFHPLRTKLDIYVLIIILLSTSLYFYSDLSDYQFFVSSDKHNMRTLSVLYINFPCTQCETGQKSSPNALFIPLFYSSYKQTLYFPTIYKYIVLYKTQIQLLSRSFIFE